MNNAAPTSAQAVDQHAYTHIHKLIDLSWLRNFTSSQSNFIHRYWHARGYFLTRFCNWIVWSWNGLCVNKESVWRKRALLFLLALHSLRGFWSVALASKHTRQEDAVWKRPGHLSCPGVTGQQPQRRFCVRVGGWVWSEVKALFLVTKWVKKKDWKCERKEVSWTGKGMMHHMS